MEHTDKAERLERHRTFRTDPHLDGALKADAAQHGRTVAESIRLHLRRALGMAA